MVVEKCSSMEEDGTWAVEVEEICSSMVVVAVETSPEVGEKCSSTEVEGT